MLAGLCVLWLPSAASSFGNIHKLANPQLPQTTCPALTQHSEQAPPHLLHTADAVFDLAVPHPCPGLATHTLAGLCALWLPSAASSFGNLHKPAKSQPPRTTCTAPLPQPPVQAPPHLLHHIAEAAFDLALPHGMPRAGHSHTGTHHASL